MNIRRASAGRIAAVFLSLLSSTLARAQASPDPAPAPEAAPPPAAPEKPAPSYEELLRRVEALEKAEAERAAAPRPASAASTAGAFGQNRFNPDLSLIADVAVAGGNLDDATARSLSIPGFLEECERGDKLRGFSFNYLELAFNAAVDPYFDFQGVVTVGGEGVEVEEAVIDSRQLPAGFGLRIGKFLSSFGRLNGQHRHTWDFYDVPLIYEGLIGQEGLKNPGLGLTWTAPVDFLLQLKAEVFHGDFEEAATFNARGYELTAADGTTLSAKPWLVPLLYAGSLKASFDVGDHVFLLGASVLYGQWTQASVEGLPTDQAFRAPDTFVYGAELTYKYLLGPRRSLTWQTEYLGRVADGDLALASDGRVHDASRRQGGLYSQLVWHIDEAGRWAAGLRYDLLTEDSSTVDGVAASLDSLLPRYTAMVQFSPTEFARFRLQYAFDQSRYFQGVQRDVSEVLLNVNVAIGPHGAHSF